MKMVQPDEGDGAIIGGAPIESNTFGVLRMITIKQNIPMYIPNCTCIHTRCDGAPSHVFTPRK